MLLLLHLSLLLLLLHSPSSTSYTDPVDADAMRALSVSLSAPTLLNWSLDADPCSWPQVTCSSAGRVTAVQVGNRSLAGTLPSSLSNLTSLVRLELHSNRISGLLPSLRGISSLQTLLLHSNLFSSIPADFFSGLSTLQSVSLDHNPFQPWTLPPSLKDAAALVNFSANDVNLTGNVPDFFTGEVFPSLTHLALAYNGLNGSLPSGFGSGLPITSLWLNNQKGGNGALSGPIDVVANMTTLEQLWLHSNEFTGPMPDLGGLGNLWDLQLRDNKLTGPVPTSLVSLKSLKKVTLTNNLLQGPVPVFSGNVNVDMDVKGESFCLPEPGDCDERVNGLILVAKAFGYPERFAADWKGNDPCDDWLGIGCNNQGNVTVINFKNMGLGGMVSADFALFPELQKLLLSGNHLTGGVPDSLTSLAELNELDLSNNSISGRVPNFGRNVVVKMDGNPNVESQGSRAESASHKPTSNSLNVDGIGSGIGNSKRQKSSSALVGVIVGSVVGGGVVPSMIVVLIFCLYKWRKSGPLGSVQSPNNMVIHPRHSSSDPDYVKISVAGSSMNGGPLTGSGSLSRTSSGFPADVYMGESGGNMVISIQVLRNVTDNFSDENVIGQGGFGRVYKGELHDGTKIAVKRMEAGVMGIKGLTEFQSEIAVLTKVRHRHLVSLLGYCLDGNERLLVYEYMPQGTLSRHLFNWKDEGLRPLEWKRRLGIALDVARGVEYLHTLAHQSFIHRDLKPLNILLGDDMKAKVADFGLVRLAPDGKCSVETRLAGTFGYLAPEYAVTGRVTTKADVFSFGVILMELITGRKALDESQPEESVHLVNWFRRMQLNKDSFRKAIDPTIDLDEEVLASVSTVAELAGHCCAREPYQRPDMGHAVNVLSSLAEIWRPRGPEPEESYGIDLEMTLPQALRKWQEFEENDRVNAASSSFLASIESTQTSIPTRPAGFADSFTSADGR